MCQTIRSELRSFARDVLFPVPNQPLYHRRKWIGRLGSHCIFPVFQSLSPQKKCDWERMHVAQRVYVTPHVFWTVGRLCVSVGDQFVMEF